MQEQTTKQETLFALKALRGELREYVSDLDTHYDEVESTLDRSWPSLDIPQVMHERLKVEFPPIETAVKFENMLDEAVQDIRLDKLDDLREQVRECLEQVEADIESLEKVSVIETEIEKLRLMTPGSITDVQTKTANILELLYNEIKSLKDGESDS